MTAKSSLVERARLRLSAALTRMLARYLPNRASARDTFEALGSLGASAYREGRLEDALATYERMAALDARSVEARRNQAIVLAKLGRLEDAVEALDDALRIQPADLPARLERSRTLIRMRRIADALVELDRILAIDPSHAAAQLNKGMCLLLTGNFREGLPLLEWRWKKAGFDPVAKFGGFPLWLGGESIDGARIRITREQGMGDMIQFCRYVPFLERRGAKVVISCAKALAPLLRTVSANTSVVELGEPLPECDFVCPALSLPLAFRTELSSIPGEAPYLSVEPAAREKWASALSAPARPAIGIAWSGNPQHGDDANRSLPVELLRPILELPFEFHVIQKEIRPEDAPGLRSLSNVHIHEIGDFMDVAAIVDRTDLVISVDTAAAHVAGAIAKPAWILLPFTPDWRWMLERADSPWYPTARLYRQPRYADWSSVIRDVVDELRPAA